MLRLIVITLIIGIVNLSYAQLSTLDTTFNNDGAATVQFANNDESFAIALQNDGKILLAGHSFDGLINYFAIARFTSDGNLDTTFGNGGKVLTSFGGANNMGQAITIQNDGKILVAGYTDNNDSTGNFAIARYNTDGGLDLSFDFDGKVTTDFGGTNDYAYSVELQADGKIVVAGKQDNFSNIDFAVARYNDNGSLDTTFDFDGRLATDLGASDDYGRSVAIQPDGKIVVVGAIETATTSSFGLVRYNLDGTLDNSFDTDGIVITALGPNRSWAFDLGIQADGKIIVVGDYAVPLSFDFALVRYNLDGSIDSTFENDGIVITDFGPTIDAGARSVVLGTDGKIYVAGVSGNFSITNLVHARYNVNGTIDSTYDNDGIISISFPGSGVVGYYIALQNDGKVLNGGSIRTGTNYAFIVARYMLSITVPSSTEENEFSTMFQLFPNPTEGKLTIRAKMNLSNAAFIVSNSLGEIVLKKSNINEDKIEVDFSDEHTGTYYISISNNGKFFRHKIIKM